MARGKKAATLTPEEKLQQALVPVEEQPYKTPENWCWIKIDSVVEILNGYAFKSQKYVDSGIRIIRIANVQDGYIEDEKPVFYPDDTESEISKYMLQEDDLLISLTGNVGRVAFLTRDMLPAALNQRVGCLRLKNVPLDLRFLFYYFLRQEFQDSCIKNSKGSAQLNMSTEWLKDQPIPYLPIAEQQRIVDRIESIFAKLDEAKEKAQAVVDGYGLRKTAILNKAFTGELTAQWRQVHQSHVNSMLDDIKTYSSNWQKKDVKFLEEEQSKAEIVTFENDHQWIKCTIGAISRVTNGSTPSRKNDEYWNGNIPWISSGEVRNNIIGTSNECITESGYENSSVKLLPVGTVLIAMIGEGKTRGQSAVLDIEATINQNIAAVVVDHGLVASHYVWYWFQMNYAKNREKGAGSGPQALNCQRVRELDFFVPNIDEQKEIIRLLDDFMLKEQQAKEAAEAVIDQIDTMKKAVLARAFRGELGTNDSAEESAMELLKSVL